MEQIHLFNNFVKAYLIKKFIRPCGNVLDMACGKGGDLKKYKHNKVGFYHGLDIVPERIKEAEVRYKNICCMFAAVFSVSDFTLPLQLSNKYDLISCQFAFHYAWNDMEKANQVLANIALHLSTNGYSILTYPDWNVIFSKLKNLERHQDEYNYHKQNCIRVGGRTYFIQFETNLPLELFLNKIENNPFGQQYIYYQQGAIDGIPEFLVHPQKLREMINAHGLTVHMDCNFNRFLEPDPEWNALRADMHATESLHSESWEIVNLYRALVVSKDQRLG